MAHWIRTVVVAMAAVAAGQAVGGGASGAGQAAGAAAGEAAAPLTAAERAVLRVGIRREFIDRVGAACGGKYPAHAKQYGEAVRAWRESNGAPLQQFDTLMLTRPGGVDDQAMGALVDEQQQVIQAWQTGKLGMSLSRAPTMAECDKLTASLGRMPPP
nr:hypothetical protein [uncultured Duganella sp.]